MTESGYTTITVREQTKERLDEHRDGRPWDQYLETLRKEHADPLTLNDAEELSDRLTEALAEDLQERINHPDSQDTETIISRLEDLETRLPAKVGDEVEGRLQR